MKNVSFLTVFLFASVACDLAAQTASPPGLQIFSPGIVSTGHNERDMAISPDGMEMFYTIQAPRNSVSVVVRRQLTNNQWGTAEIASFSGQFSDLEPAYATDGKRLYFVSNRPLSPEGGPKDYDIWYVEKNGALWGQPIHAGPEINSAGDEYYPSVTTDGSLYFTAARPDALGKEDIYKSQWAQNHFEKPVNIGAGVNSVLDEFNAFVDPAERYIIYGVEGGEGDLGRGDLYISYRNADLTWTKAKNLGEGINSKRLDYCPFIYQNMFYFTSERTIAGSSDRQLTLKEITNALDNWGNGWGDIYTIPLNQIIKN